MDQIPSSIPESEAAQSLQHSSQQPARSRAGGRFYSRTTGENRSSQSKDTFYLAGLGPGFHWDLIMDVCAVHVIVGISRGRLPPLIFIVVSIMGPLMLS